MASDVRNTTVDRAATSPVVVEDEQCFSDLQSQTKTLIHITPGVITRARLLQMTDGKTEHELNTSQL
eukprot:3250244-Amphidinium_carterae.1